MPGIVIVALILLWVLGVVQVPGIAIRNFTLFRLGGHTVTLLEVLILLVLLWAVETLPSPLRELTVLAVILWLLSTLGIIVVSGLPNIIVLAVILGLALTYLRKKNERK